MAHIECFKVGDWFVVVREIPYDMTYDQANNYIPPILDGIPLKVVGVAAPFIAYINPKEPNRVETVDTTRWLVSKTDKKYAEPFLAKLSDTTKEKLQETKVIQTTKVEHSYPICKEGRFIVVMGKEGMSYNVCKAELRRPETNVGS